MDSRPYETEQDRIREHVRRDLTPRQRLEHWWYYHWYFVLIAAAAVGLGLYFASSWGSAVPEDCSVAWVGAYYLDEGTQQALEKAFIPYAEDVNGDGQVVVRIHQFALDLRLVAQRGTSGQQEYADLLALDADLNCGQSTIFLLEDPEAFQAYSGALLYLDGTEPPMDGSDWENMVVSWQDTVGPLPEGAQSPLWLGCRGCWKAGQREGWESSRRLWEHLTAAAQIPL